MITNKDTVNKSMPLFYLQQFHKLPMISESSKKGMVKKLAIMLNKTEDQSFLTRRNESTSGCFLFTKERNGTEQL
jgi:hypothetical protein